MAATYVAAKSLPADEAKALRAGKVFGPELQGTIKEIGIVREIINVDFTFLKNRKRTKTAKRAPVNALDATSEMERSIMLVVFTVSVIIINKEGDEHSYDKH